MRPVAVGQTGRFEQVVHPAHSAANYGNTGVHVLATPVLCHWFETTAVVAIHANLETGEATVGTELSIEHLKATPVGMAVRVEAQVIAIEGRRLTFEIEARDEIEVIARGRHQRYVVNLERFLENVKAKSGTAGS